MAAAPTSATWLMLPTGLGLTMANMSATDADGHRQRHRSLHAPTAGFLLEVFCWILNAGNPAPRARWAEVEVSAARR
jgi:hypothetical protein